MARALGGEATVDAVWHGGTLDIESGFKSHELSLCMLEAAGLDAVPALRAALARIVHEGFPYKWNSDGSRGRLVFLEQWLAISLANASPAEREQLAKREHWPYPKYIESVRTTAGYGARHKAIVERFARSA